MLSPWERGVFLLLAVLSVLGTAHGLWGVVGSIRRGTRHESVRITGKTVVAALLQVVFQQRTFRTRRTVALFHLFVVWGFLYYGLVNVGDLLEGFIPGFRFLGHGWPGGLYRLGADVLSVAVLVGVAYLAYRRFVLKPQALRFHERVLLHPGVARGIPRDSAIVFGFITLHVGSRFLGQSFRVAAEGGDPWQPFAATVAVLWQGWPPEALAVAEHVAWWLSLGLILAFLPYFPYSKHFHLVVAPINLALDRQRPALGSPHALPLNPAPGPFGSHRLEELPWPRLVDAFACIMCNRCQEVCPAYAAGTRLSPAAMEINKRFVLKGQMHRLAAREASPQPLTETVIPEDAVWACTTCAACVAICPVGNEPLQDIVDIRRFLVLTEGRPPTRGGQVLRNIRFAGNPWGQNPEERGDWAVDLNVPTLAEKGTCDVLYWVGCSGSFDPRGQAVARAVVQLLQRAGLDVAILGPEEWCTGDPARRMGDEDLFQACRRRNLDTLQKYEFRQIVTACPHCWNVLRNEYAANGSGIQVPVRHHTQVLADLLAAGRLRVAKEAQVRATFHDPCYLGRYNGETSAPRSLVAAVPGLTYHEMPRHGRNSFCCGGGGGGAFYDIGGERRITDIRLEEASQVADQVLLTACPYCAIMFEGSAIKGEMRIQDVAELLVSVTEGGGEPRV